MNWNFHFHLNVGPSIKERRSDAKAQEKEERQKEEASRKGVLKAIAGRGGPRRSKDWRGLFDALAVCFLLVLFGVRGSVGVVQMDS